MTWLFQCLFWISQANEETHVSICRVKRSKFPHFLYLQHRRSEKIIMIIYCISWFTIINKSLVGTNGRWIYSNIFCYWSFRFGWTYTAFRSLDLVVRLAHRYLKKLGVTHQLVLVVVLVWVAQKIHMHAWMNLRQVPWFCYSSNSLCITFIILVTLNEVLILALTCLWGAKDNPNTRK